MSYAIKFLSLQKSELEYEVELRGGIGESVQELRKQIVKLSLQLPSEDILESHLQPSDDLKGVKESLLKTQNNLAGLKSKFDRNLFSRTETLLNHIYHRLNRINIIPDVAENYKVCVSSFNNQYKELSALRPHALASQSKPQTSAATNENTLDVSSITVTCERNLTTDIGKLRYSGKSCVRAFIQKVEEFASSRGIANDKILSFAFEIFSEDALHWYRCVKNDINSWNELAQLLRRDFGLKNYDYQFISEIRSRTQGENENITIYLAIMHGMFSRLDRMPSEEEKLEILLHNIRPCYASTLAASAEIKSIDSLKSVCRNYEDIQSRFFHFREPPKVSSSTLAPEFSYKPSPNTVSSSTNNVKQHNYNNQKNSYTSYNKPNFTTNYKKDSEKFDYNYKRSVDVAALTSGPPRTIFCPRCRTDDHSLKNCKEERFPICFKCGKKDVRFSECPDCNPTSTENSKN